MTAKKLMLLFGLDGVTIFYDLQFALGSFIYVFVGASAYIVSCFYSHKFCIYGGERSAKNLGVWINSQIFANILLPV